MSLLVKKYMGMGGSGGVLPAGYIPYDYIKSDGVAFVDTGIVPNANTMWKMSLFLDTDGYDTSNAFANGAEPNAAKRFVISAQGWAMFIGIFNRYKASSFRFDRQKTSHRGMIKADGSYEMDNESGKLASTYSEITISITLFARHTGPATYTNKNSHQRIYSSELFDGSNLIQKLIPCYKIDSSEFGFYDSVTETFFGNIAGSGALIGGND